MIDITYQIGCRLFRVSQAHEKCSVSCDIEPTDPKDDPMESALPGGWSHHWLKLAALCLRIAIIARSNDGGYSNELAKKVYRTLPPLLKDFDNLTP